MVDGQALQDGMVALIRAFGLHRPDVTPCGQAVGVSAAHALMELAQGQPLSPSRLAERLLLDKSTVSRLVAQLEQGGWVRRERAAADGRSVCLSLTAEGQALAGRLAATRAARFSRLLARIPAGERGAVLRSLRLLAQAAGAGESPAGGLPSPSD